MAGKKKPGPSHKAPKSKPLPESKSNLAKAGGKRDPNAGGNGRSTRVR